MNGDEGVLDGVPPHVAAEFFVWLWYTSEVGQATVEVPDLGEIGFWVDDRITMRAPGEDKASTVLTGEQPAVAPEARAALAGGKVLRDLRLMIRREEREYVATLKGPRVSLGSVKLPGLIKTGDVAEILYERMFLYEELHFILAALFRRFAAERCGPEWHTRVLPGLRRWVAGARVGDATLDEAPHRA